MTRKIRNLKVVSSASLGGGLYNGNTVRIYKNLLLTFNSTNAFIFDITSGALTLLSTIAGAFNGGELFNGFLILYDNSNHFIYDISDSSNPVLNTTTANGASYSYADTETNRLYEIWTNGTNILCSDVSPRGIVFFINIGNPSGAILSSIIYNNGFLYCSGAIARSFRINTDNSLTQVLYGPYTGTSPSDLAIDGNYLYFTNADNTTSQYLYIFDITDQNNPLQIYHKILIDQNYVFVGISVYDSFLCILVGDRGLLIYDVLDKTTPKMAYFVLYSSLVSPGHAIKATRTYIYLSTQTTPPITEILGYSYLRRALGITRILNNSRFLTFNGNLN